MPGLNCVYCEDRTDRLQTGAGTSCSRLGMADLGLASLHDMRAQADMICNLDPEGAPVIADMDGGYGVCIIFQSDSYCSHVLTTELHFDFILPPFAALAAQSVRLLTDACRRDP